MQTQEYKLNNAGIAEMVEDVRTALRDEKVERNSSLRILLTLEELLLRIQESGAAPDVCEISVGKRFGRTILLLRWRAEAFDPTSSAEEDGWSFQILSNLGLAPTWSYRGGVNTVKLRPPKGASPGRIVYLLGAVVLAAVLGAAGQALPDALISGVSEYLLTPVFKAFIGLLNTFAGLLIFLTVAAGVFGIGDTASLDRIGKTMFPRYILSAFIVSAATLAVTRPFFHLRAAEAVSGSSQLGEISEMLFNILPSNLVRPFLDGNTLQIIVLAAFTGVVLLILGEQTRHVDQLIEELGSVLRMMMEQVCKLIPLFVFVSLLRQIWSGTVGQLLSLWKPFCLFALVNVLMIAALVLMAGARTKTSIALLLRKVFPSFLVAFTTASSMAAYSTGVDACTKRLGIDRRLIDFGFPIGIVIYMPSGVTTFALLSGYLAEVYDVEVNLSWFIMAGILAAVLSIAIPPTPGAMLTCYGILMAQLGIPAEGLLLAATLDVVLDFFMTGIDILTLELELVCQADSLHMLDREVLRREA